MKSNNYNKYRRTNRGELDHMLTFFSGLSLDSFLVNTIEYCVPIYCIL